VNPEKQGKPLGLGETGRSHPAVNNQISQTNALRRLRRVNKKRRSSGALAIPEFSLRIGFPLKEEDHLKHPTTLLPAKRKKNRRNYIKKRFEYAEQVR